MTVAAPLWATLCLMLAAAQSPGASAREELQDLIRKFSDGLEITDATQFRNLHRYTDAEKPSGESWLCGEIDRDGDGRWARFYVRAQSRMIIYPHATLDTRFADQLTADCHRTAAAFHSGTTSRESAQKACTAALAVSQARLEQSEFNTDYLTWCGLGPAAKELPLQANDPPKQ